MITSVIRVEKQMITRAITMRNLIAYLFRVQGAAFAQTIKLNEKRSEFSLDRLTNNF